MSPEAPIYYDASKGKWIWDHQHKGERNALGVHQLVAIANGVDPHSIFNNETCVVTHKNGIGWDNRHENIELKTRSEALMKYTDEELLEWIDAFVHEFGVVPSCEDVRAGWPGPSESTYEARFGSVARAVKAAGYEPRGTLRD